MATQADSLTLPNGDGTLTFSSARPAAFFIQQVDDDSGEMVSVHVGTAPLGTSRLYQQNRKRGDWYCELLGNRHVAAIGADRADACRNAIAKLSA